MKGARQGPNQKRTPARQGCLMSLSRGAGDHLGGDCGFSSSGLPRLRRKTYQMSTIHKRPMAPHMMVGSQFLAYFPKASRMLSIGLLLFGLKIEVRLAVCSIV